MTPGQEVSRLKAHLKKTRGMLFVAEVDGVLWGSDSYFAVRLRPDGPATRLLAQYNLTPQPGIFEVDSAVSIKVGAPPNLAALVLKPDVFEPAERHTIGTAPVSVWSADYLCDMYTTADGAAAAVNHDYRLIVESLTGRHTWHLNREDVTRPLGQLDENGAVCGLLMPVRCGLPVAAEGA